MSCLDGGKRPQDPDGGKRSAFTELPPRHWRGRGSSRGHPPPPIPNWLAPQSRGRGNLRSPAGASAAAGARAEQAAAPTRACRPAPPHGRSLRSAGLAHTVRGTRSRAPPLSPHPQQRGLRANGGAGARLGLARSLPPPRRMAATSGQRRFLAPALTVRWAFESGPGLTFRDARPKALALPLPPNLTLADLPNVLGCPPAQDPSSPSQAPEKLAASGARHLAFNTLRDTSLRRMEVVGTPATQQPRAPSLFRAIPLAKTISGGFKEGKFPFSGRSASASFPDRPSAGSLATNSPCC